MWEFAVVQTCIVHYADLRIMPMWRRDPGKCRSDVIVRRSKVDADLIPDLGRACQTEAFPLGPLRSTPTPVCVESHNERVVMVAVTSPAPPSPQPLLGCPSSLLTMRTIANRDWSQANGKDSSIWVNKSETKPLKSSQLVDPPPRYSRGDVVQLS